MKNLLLFLSFTLISNFVNAGWVIIVNKCKQNGGLFGYRNVSQTWDYSSFSNGNVYSVFLDCENPGLASCRLTKPILGGGIVGSPDEYGNNPNEIANSLAITFEDIYNICDNQINQNQNSGKDVIKIEHTTPSGTKGFLILRYSWNGNQNEDGLIDSCVKIEVEFQKW